MRQGVVRHVPVSALLGGLLGLGLFLPLWLGRLPVGGGGTKLEAGGSIIAGIGVSGAPGGDSDDVCAQAGIKAIADSLEF